VRDFVAPELEQADAIHPRRAVVADEVFTHPQVVAVGDPAGVHTQVSRVLAAPFPEVLYAFEPLTGLGKLQHGVVMVDLMGDVLVRARIVPVAFESEHEVFLVEHHSPPGIGGSNLVVLVTKTGGAAWWVRSTCHGGALAGTWLSRESH
jgi:hypothetical protein